MLLLYKISIIDFAHTCGICGVFRSCTKLSVGGTGERQPGVIGGSFALEGVAKMRWSEMHAES